MIGNVHVLIDNKMGICCFSAKHAALRRKSKDWLARNQNNLSEWSDMSTGPHQHPIENHWRMSILECSQGCYGRADGSVTISLRNFVGEGIIVLGKDKS
jgi:hypothetical protein